MADKYKRKDDNNKSPESYRQSLLKQNLWRCDCSDEGEHTSIHRHESSCRYGVWYVENDLHIDQGD